jgi:hypothetical protein
VEAIPGYIESGAFAADAERFFPNAEKLAVDLPKKIEKIGKMPSARGLLAALRSKKLPVMGVALDLSTFGFDASAEALPGASDKKYVGIASDGSGNMYLLDTTTGKVIPYAHEEDKLDATGAFDSLDAFAFALVRVEAAARKQIPKRKLGELFARLKLKGGVLALKRY